MFVNVLKRVHGEMDGVLICNIMILLLSLFKMINGINLYLSLINWSNLKVQEQNLHTLLTA